MDEIPVLKGKCAAASGGGCRVRDALLARALSAQVELAQKWRNSLSTVEISTVYRRYKEQKRNDRF